MAIAFSFYSKVDPPDKWTLADLLYWLAMRCLPQRYYNNGESIEGRESVDVFFENAFSYGAFFKDVYFEPEETSLVGLSNDPRWENLENQDSMAEYLMSSNYHERMSNLVFDGDPIQTKSNREQQQMLAKKAKEYELRTEKWLLELSDYMDRFIAKLIIDLRDGVIVSEGIRVKGQPDGEHNEDLGKNLDLLISSQKEYELAFETIPSEYWVTRRINWDAGFLQADEETFLGVRLNAKDILKHYPPTTQGQISVNKYGCVLVRSEKNTLNKPKRSNRGRPQKNWEQVYLRIAEVIAQRGALPTKQDSFAEELAEWYRRQFKVDIGLTTIKARLKPYYNNSVFQKSE